MAFAAHRARRDDVSRLSLNQATIRRACFKDALSIARAAGIESVGLWREPVEEIGLDAAAAALRSSGLRCSSLCRGGFFTATEALERRRAIEDNKRAIHTVATLAAAAAAGSAAVLVLVAGGLPPDSRDLVGARSRVVDAIAELLPTAADAGVTLAVEPLHPMYAADRAVVNTLGQALDIAEHFPAAEVGVVVDAFHVWWDPSVSAQIARAGAGGRIASFQVSDWLTPIATDPLLSRGLMGDGHIDFQSLVVPVAMAGYEGDVEVEIFNQEIWDADPLQVARRVVALYAAEVAL
jgi:sugar phosphate isomerase/epimerase